MNLERKNDPEIPASSSGLGALSFIAEPLSQAQALHPKTVGLNWQMIHAGGNRRIWQEGNLPISMCMTFPELHLAVVFLANEDDPKSSHALPLYGQSDCHDAGRGVGASKPIRSHAAGYTPSTFTISATTFNCSSAPLASRSSPRRKSA